MVINIFSYPSSTETVFNMCLKAGRISGKLSPTWSIGGCTNADSIKSSIKRVPNCIDNMYQLQEKDTKIMVWYFTAIERCPDLSLSISSPRFHINLFFYQFLNINQLFHFDQLHQKFSPLLLLFSKNYISTHSVLAPLSALKIVMNPNLSQRETRTTPSTPLKLVELTKE